MFDVAVLYTKQDIYRILNVDIKQQRGAWDTGYREYNNNIFLFSNIGIPGRTGHDYKNYWDGDLFHWEAKSNTKLNNPLIQKMINADDMTSIHLFTRTDNRDHFLYEGKVKALKYYDSSPVKIVWQLISESH